ncbi:D-alanyl-D-alanine carboxypeptidase [Ligilactobacillus sp. WILCCON 0076]|uniref:serine-type D-Ala-D-Ala carboxypeptidase n=1 Tax=Ligilactobacillus ubinensis TaxID=2876789 RepID=A0A9X2FL55_9LACO|nr:D-alanyl-D-alanine carboxypeptidase family protein [Ligilactobacillus ubinensis]MCP0887229.1 D-alanyl-D-alanine carboxypeptidase [Ligilactobacillus ubinensis]
MKFFKNLKKTFIGIITGVTLFTAGAAGFGGIASVSAASLSSNSDSSLSLDVKAAIAVDAKTGQVLYSKNAETALPVASMSKLLTTYLILKAIHSGKLSWDQKITPDSAAQSVSQDTSLSNVPLESGHSYTVRSLYQAMLIYSANGATMALAYKVGGNSYKNFINMMRKQAKEFGITDASIYTANGLTNGEVGDAAYPGASSTAENKFSAKDMAIIATKLLKKYPEVLKTTSITKKYFNNGTGKTLMSNWNWMLKGLAKSYSELPVDGLKTGTSDTAGACFTGTVNKDGHRIITVVLGAQHTSDTDTSRFVQTQKLMSYVYNNYTYTKINSGSTYSSAKTLPVHDGKTLTTNVATGTATHIWLKNSTSSSNLTASVSGKKSLYKDSGLQAPLKKGETVGTYSFKVKGQSLYFLDGSTSLKTNAVTKSATSKANIFVIGWRAITGLFK